MLLLKLIEETELIAVYHYFPEQKEYFGSVTIDKETGEITDVQTASNDIHERYMYHAISKIISFFQNGLYKTDEVVAWY